MMNFWEFIVVLMLVMIYLVPIMLKLGCYAWSSYASRRRRLEQTSQNAEDARSEVYSIEFPQNSNQFTYDPPPSYDSVVKELTIDTGQTNRDMKVISSEVE